MKQRNTISKQFFGHSTAIIAIVISVLGLVSFAGVTPNNPAFPLLSTDVVECFVSVADNAAIPVAALRTETFSSPRNCNMLSFRRLACESQSPFVWSEIYASGCGTVQTVYITPAPHTVANPAIFVRAGPNNASIISKVFIG
ncbi:MAG: hypothetical protein E7053_01190 [Lentisphaerae bacterium]|nr:hypothetical protein [Lentisphaerota bacterium]